MLVPGGTLYGGSLRPSIAMNKLTDVLHIPDTQSGRDERHLAIQRVGIRDVRYPLRVAVAGRAQTTPATWSLDVALPAEQKGTHMSRFVAWLNDIAARTEPLDAATLRAAGLEMLQRLHASSGRVHAHFTVFIEKRAPVSGVPSLLDIQAGWLAEAREGGVTVWAEVAVPVKSLCPCSKEISDYGAHNQRSQVRIHAEVKDGTVLDWSELVRMAEESASSEIWPLLKRADEKWITERAYENPKFVEDLVRDVALRLNADARIGRYRVEVENFESIHNHSAFAVIERG
jgi:GTP cyclohydrolase IB